MELERQAELRTIRRLHPDLRVDVFVPGLWWCGVDSTFRVRKRDRECASFRGYCAHRRPQCKRALERASTLGLVAGEGFRLRAGLAATTGRDACGVEPPRAVLHQPPVLVRQGRDGVPPQGLRPALHHGFVTLHVHTNDAPLDSGQTDELRARRIPPHDRCFYRLRRFALRRTSKKGKRLRRTCCLATWQQRES